MILSNYVGGGLTYDQLEAAAFDYLTFGDMAIAKIRNGWGDVIGLEPPSPACISAAVKCVKKR